MRRHPPTKERQRKATHFFAFATTIDARSLTGVAQSSAVSFDFFGRRNVFHFSSNGQFSDFRVCQYDGTLGILRRNFLSN
jgi:hypothetical protein